jgi:hypothetical protein
MQWSSSNGERSRNTWGGVVFEHGTTLHKATHGSCKSNMHSKDEKMKDDEKWGKNEKIEKHEK